MTTEKEKAKRYDEALEWMREFYPGLHGETKEDAEHYFPELKESEDERIRKELIGLISCMHDADPRKKRWIAYLEKQKEQKPVTINQDEKEFLADEITAFLCNYDKEFDGEDPVPSEVAEHFYLLGKQAQEQKSAEWSEEDERTRKTIIRVLKSFVSQADCESNSALSASYPTYYKEIDWLESRCPQLKQEQKEPSDKGEISDGYHTFNELYYYRLLYNAAFFNLLPKEWVHKSKRHHDGEECFGGGWFIVMANLPTGQISNHYEIKDWDLFHIPEKETADEWDGHTPQQAAERLHKFLLEMQDSMPIAWRDIREDKQKPEAKLTGWVARDSKYNSYFGLGLVLFKGKPRRSGECWSGAIAAQLPWELFPDLKWMGEPMEVEITITKK